MKKLITIGIVFLALSACKNDKQEEKTIEVQEVTENNKEVSISENPLKEAYFGESHMHTQLSLDAYIGGHPISLYFYNDKFKSIDKGESVRGAYKYNIMSEGDFKAKHTPKLTFEGHDVDVSTTRIKIGCQTYDKEEVETFFEIATDLNDNNVSWHEAYTFIKENYQELGL